MGSGRIGPFIDGTIDSCRRDRARACIRNALIASRVPLDPLVAIANADDKRGSRHRS